MAKDTPFLPVAIRRVPLFAAMGEQDLASILEATSPMELAPGETLFRRGDPGDAVYLVESGFLEAVIDEGLSTERVLSSFGSGDFFGEMALLTGERRSATIRAERSSRLLCLSKARFDELLETSPRIGVGLSKVLSQRLAAANQQLSSRTSYVSAVVSIDDQSPAELLMTQLVASLRRQIDGEVVLVLLAVSPPTGIGAATSEPGPRNAADQAQTLPGGGRWLHLGPSFLDHAADGEVASLLGELRRRFGHVLVWTTAAFLAQHAAVLARCDRICLLARGPGAADALTGAVREGDWTGVAHRGHLRLVQMDSMPRRAPLLGALGLRPIQISTEPNDHGARAAVGGGVDRLARALAGRTVGLALSGGAAQGVAHLGVMEGLLEAGIPIDLIAGTSGGSLYGSLVASGMPVRRAQQVVIRQTRRNLNDRADFTVPRRGLIAGRRIAGMVREALGEITFDDLAFPLYAVATDLDSGEEVVIDDGPVYQAVRASISVPGVFEPYRLRGRLLVDGGVVNPMPVSVARRKGADLVIAVQVPAPGKAAEQSDTYVSRQLGTNHNLLSIMVRTYYFAGDELAKRGASEADLLIRPPVAHFGWRDYRSAPAIIRHGYRAAQEAAAHIRTLWWGTIGVR